MMSGRKFSVFAISATNYWHWFRVCDFCRDQRIHLHENWLFKVQMKQKTKNKKSTQIIPTDLLIYGHQDARKMHAHVLTATVVI